jgi:oligopeptide transport system substrate-binding protein
LFSGSWGADYPTAWDILESLLGSEPPGNPGANRGLNSNKTVDGLLAGGQAEPDPTKRADDYRQAEKIAIGEDLGLIPLWYRTQYSAFSKKFVGVNLDFFQSPTLGSIGLR